MKSLKRLLPYLRPETGALGIAYFFMVILAITNAFYAFLAGPALKFVFTGNVRDVIRQSSGELRSFWEFFPPEALKQLEALDDNAALFLVPALIVITAVIKGVAQTGQFYFMGQTSQRALRRIRQKAFDALIRQSPSFFHHRSHGDLLSRLTNDANLIEQGLFYGFGAMVREPLSIIALLFFCFYTDSTLALVTFITVPVAVLPLLRFTKWLKKVSRRGQNAQGDINAVSYEALAGVRVVQAFGTEKREAEKLDAAAGRYYQQMLRSYFIRAVRTPTMEIMGAFALAALLGFLGYRVRDTGADPAHFISFFVAIVMMYDPLKRLGRVSDYLAAGSAAGDRLFEVMDAPRDIEDAPDAIEAAPFQDKVVFENIHFAYNNEPVLRGISLQLKQGDIVALVGASGSGKTTLANLLPRFYDIKEGSLRLDDVELKTLKIDSLRKQISVVSQDTFLFNLSIAENIAYGSPKASEQDIVQAAKSAYADEFITRLENGYDTVIGERGMTLSGGQRQRVAIARSILRNAPILILDEATSALDIESERFVQNALEQLMKDRTSLVIAHRLSTVRRADIIYVLKEGQIAESGKHDELLAKGGEYARLYEMQFDSTDNEPQSAALTA